MNMEKLVAVLVSLTLLATSALVITGCVVGIYWLVGLVG